MLKFVSENPVEVGGWICAAIVALVLAACLFRGKEAPQKPQKDAWESLFDDDSED